MNYQALKAELADPRYAAAIAVGDDQSPADWLNTTIETGRKPAALADVKRAAILGGFWFAVKTAAASHSDMSVRGAAQTAIDYVEDLRFEAMDLDLPAVRTMLAALVAGSVITTEQQTALIALGDEPVSRAKRLFGQNITHTDVAIALRG